MDTSEQYIKMCEKAEEIQSVQPEAYKSIFWCRAHNLEIGLDYDCQPACDGAPYNLRKECMWVWLPRQDQLQEMVEYDWTGDLIRRFYNWGKERGFQTKAIKSMEQLWLAFVMKETFNKVWDGEKWVK